MRRYSMFLVLALSACTTQSGTDKTGDQADDQTDPGYDQPTTVSHVTCPPPSVSEAAVCVCEDVAHIGELNVTPGPGGVGSVGVNGVTRMSGLLNVDGDLATWGGLVNTGTINGSLITPASVTGGGVLTIGGDATIGGDLDRSGLVTITGSLGLGGDERVIGGLTTGSRVDYVAPTAPPCGCDPATFFDVVAAVDAAKQITNAEPSWDHVGIREIRLAGGNYFVTAADVIGMTAIYVDGSASVYVEGSLSSIGAAQWVLAPGATLDLFVSGSVGSVGNLSVGNPADPTAFRLYIGGSQSLHIDGGAEIAASIYAPTASLDLIGDARILGSLFVKSIDGSGRLYVEYGDGSTPPTTCQPEDDGDDVPTFI